MQLPNLFPKHGERLKWNEFTATYTWNCIIEHHATVNLLNVSCSQGTISAWSHIDPIIKQQIWHFLKIKKNNKHNESLFKSHGNNSINIDRWNKKNTEVIPSMKAIPQTQEQELKKKVTILRMMKRDISNFLQDIKETKQVFPAFL